MTDYRPIPHHPSRLSPETMLENAQRMHQSLESRRSVRFFSDEPVDPRLIEYAVRIASTAPSGANRQPWRFVVVDDAELKRKIRVAAEEEERVSYEGGRMPEAWLDALRPLGTDWEKPFLEVAPYLVVLFKQVWSPDEAGRKVTNYYVNESVGIAAGLFISAIQEMGLATLTHTPSPMGFLQEILEAPSHEKPYLLLPVGHVATDCVVPDIQRKPLGEVIGWNRGEHPWSIQTT
jgi:iodotyrosine deiodinase